MVIELMPEYGGHVLWCRTPGRMGPVNLADLGLPAELQERLEEWRRDWESDVLGLTEVEFDRHGQQLAADLRAALGPRVEVVYDA